MSEPSRSDSKRAWLWAIDYLASFPQIDPSILHDLIDVAPDLTEDSGKNTLEMVALRCLEHLSGSSNEVANNDTSAAKSKETIDISESCEHVLQSILKETSVSDLTMARSDLLKWDVQLFIMQKRASMPKCALKQLKDKILDGTHPYAASLIGPSGLMHGDEENNRNPKECGHHNVVSRRIDGNGTDTQIMALEGSTVSLPLANNLGIMGNSHKRNLVPMKRNEGDMNNDSRAGYQADQRSVSDGDLHLNVKRYKHNASSANESVEQILSSQFGNELVEESFKRKIGVAEKENLHVESESQVGERRSLENGHGKFVAIEKIGGNPNADAMDEIQPNQCDNADDANKMLQGTCRDEPCQDILAGEVNEAEPRALICAPRTLQKVSADDTRDNSDFDNQQKSVNAVSCSGSPGKITVENSENNNAVAIEKIGGNPNADAMDEIQHNQCDDADDANIMLQDTCRDGPCQDISTGEVNEAEPSALTGAPSMRTLQKVSVDETRDNSDFDNRQKSANAVSSSGSPREITVENSEDSMQHHYEEDTSSNSDEYHYEKVDVAREKSHFLSSQCTLNHASLSDWTELNLCVKCSKDAQLLVCSAVGCPLVVHEKCLGCSPRFDEKGNFYCPFCAYSYAISKYIEAKEKAALARKELDAFINKSPMRSHSEEHCTIKQNGDEVLLDKIHESENLGVKESDQTNNEGHACKVNSQLKKRKGDNEPEAPTVSCTDVNLMRGEEEPDIIHGINPICLGEKESEGMALKYLSQSVRGLDGQDQVFPNSECNIGNSLCKNKENLSLKQRGRGGIQKGVLEQQSNDLFVKPACAVNIGEGRTTNDENEGNKISNYSIRSRRPEVQYAYPAMPLLRRKKVPWTAEEEEMLKEGVQKFANTGGKTIPWKNILEYGSSVFWSGRTTIDLKDKWRNMSRGSTKGN